MHRLPALLLLCAGCVSVQAQPAYDYAHLQREQLGRGFIAVRDEQSDSVVFSWRLLKSDTVDVLFNVLKDGKRLNEKEITRSTFFKTIDRDFTSATLSHYTLQCVDGKSHEPSSVLFPLTASNPQADYLCIPLDKPSDGFTPDGRRFGYLANDASVGDADGDGEYEVFLKWEPTNAHDNSHDGYTGNVLLDCYRLSGERLWRIDLGRNIRAGAHYTQFMVYDLDGDGRAEVVMKTADGTRDGVGQCIGDSTANYVGQTGRAQGRILEGPEYLSVFDGLTGRNLYTTDYVPPRGNLADWGDTYGNRSERYLACIAYLDGHHPSVVMCRGYYTRTVLAAWDWDGQTLQQRWVFDTDDPRWRGYAGQGNHNLRVADVDADGCDEITYGSMAIDNDGTGLYNTRMGHGDALHLMPFYPDSTTLQVWDVHENRRDGSTLRDARTGRIIFQLKSNTDVGRGMAADIDPTSPGVEMWSSDSRGLRNVRGEVIAERVRIPINFAVWWDGDLLREMLDHERISKYDWTKQQSVPLKVFSPDGRFNNGSKSNPCLSADLLGDWREEVIVRTADSRELRIYTTTHPTSHRIPCLMEDIPYRLSVATENVGYNQPPETGFYLGKQ
ncbi:MAG: rhamnogalacturonan lyase [Bacteroidaceae bacterium]|nr:rhamnogalacturonan lyase [Bacteroidaceae bacterium]